MVINYKDHNNFFYAKLPKIDTQKRMTFQNKNCTHFLIISASVDDELDILKNGMIERISESDYDPDSADVKSIKQYKLRFVKQSSYVAIGNFVQMDDRSSAHSVYGCVYNKNEGVLNIFIPDKLEDSQVFVPYNVKYSVKRHMTEPKSGFLGIGKKAAEFTGYYRVNIENLQDYQNGSIYYTVGSLNYFVTKEMLGKNIFIKAGRGNEEPAIKTTNKSITLIKM